jgi:hypothetical protein
VLNALLGTTTSLSIGVVVVVQFLQLVVPVQNLVDDSRRPQRTRSSTSFRFQRTLNGNKAVMIGSFAVESSRHGQIDAVYEQQSTVATSLLVAVGMTRRSERLVSVCKSYENLVAASWWE